MAANARRIAGDVHPPARPRRSAAATGGVTLMVTRRPPGSAPALSGAPSRTMKKNIAHPSRRS
jgi:hypothetical protein